METVMCLPLFIIMLQAMVCAMQVFQDRLELIRLTREAAVFAAKSGGIDSETVQKLAARGRLNGVPLQCKLEALQLPLGGIPVPLGPLEAFKEITFGQRLTLACPVRLRPPWKWAFSDGLVMTESLAIKTDPWKRPGKKLILQLFKAALPR